MSIFDDIGDGIKKLLNATREAQAKLTGAIGKLVRHESFTDEALEQLPDGVTPSESWAKLTAALEEVERHANAIVGDWENQKHVAALLENTRQRQE